MPMFNAPGENRSVNAHGSPMTFEQKAWLWLLFFLICLGLGYSPLNRYDPGKLGGTSDVAQYRDIVVGRAPRRTAGAIGAFARLAQSENYYRVLVPYVAKPFYWLARGHVRTWDTALFGLLVANAIFTATTACLLVAIGYRLTLDFSTALLGATLYLLNFCVANLNLVGLIDSAEGCFVMVIVWSLLTGRWFLLPLWGVFGALAKETFAPLSAMFVFGWWISGVQRNHLQLSRLAWVGALGVASITHGNRCHVGRRGWTDLALAVCRLHESSGQLYCGTSRVHSRSHFWVCFYLVAAPGDPAPAPFSAALGLGHGLGVLRSIGSGRL